MPSVASQHDLRSSCLMRGNPDKSLTSDEEFQEENAIIVHAKHIDLISVKACSSLGEQNFSRGALRVKEECNVMTSQPDCSPAKLSRRSVLLHGAACATGVATVLVASANYAKANQLPKTAVNYQNTPKGDRQCSGCSLFVAPHSCKNVAGDISPTGWCVLWRKA
jgi:hypothetical protein